MKQKHTKYTQPNQTQPKYTQVNQSTYSEMGTVNCRNCSSKCAYDCAKLP